MPNSTFYNRKSAINYALKYASSPNPEYIYFQGNDCTNFVSQCLRAGGAKNHFHPTHPWWYQENQASISWSVAHSLYWYIKVCSQEQGFGIKAKTLYINGDQNYNSTIADNLHLGDIIQYRNSQGRIKHSTIVTGFNYSSNVKEPLISQHTFNAANISWRKGRPQTIFHHITSINL